MPGGHNFGHERFVHELMSSLGGWQTSVKGSFESLRDSGVSLLDGLLVPTGETDARRCGKQFSRVSHSLAVCACPLLQDNIDWAWLLKIPVSTLQLVHAVL